MFINIDYWNYRKSKVISSKLSFVRSGRSANQLIVEVVVAAIRNSRLQVSSNIFAHSVRTLSSPRAKPRHYYHNYLLSFNCTCNCFLVLVIIYTSWSRCSGTPSDSPVGRSAQSLHLAESVQYVLQISITNSHERLNGASLSKNPFTNSIEYIE